MWFFASSVLIGTGVLTFGVIRNKKQNERMSYQCGKYGAAVASDTGDKEEGLSEGKKELQAEGIHYSSTTLKNWLSFHQGFEDNYHIKTRR